MLKIQNRVIKIKAISSLRNNPVMVFVPNNKSMFLVLSSTTQQEMHSTPFKRHKQAESTKCYWEQKEHVLHPVLHRLKV